MKIFYQNIQNINFALCEILYDIKGIAEFHCMSISDNVSYIPNFEARNSVLLEHDSWIFTARLMTLSHFKEIRRQNTFIIIKSVNKIMVRLVVMQSLIMDE